MSKKAASDAIFALLSDNWTQTPILSVNDARFTPSDGGPWVRLEFYATDNRQTTLGRTYRENGAFRIVVGTEIGSGLDRSNDYCEQIASIFRNRKFDGVECKTPSIREGIDDGGYFVATVVVPYRFDYMD